MQSVCVPLDIKSLTFCTFKKKTKNSRNTKYKNDIVSRDKKWHWRSSKSNPNTNQGEGVGTEKIKGRVKRKVNVEMITKRHIKRGSPLSIALPSTTTEHQSATCTSLLSRTHTHTHRRIAPKSYSTCSY